jgi:hypothetical protein
MTDPDDTPTETFYAVTTPLEVTPGLDEGLARHAGCEDGLTCARCLGPTGNFTQGHYWSHCKVSGRYEDFHFCCPGNCELQATRRT